jgi:hypothetical protein
MSSFRVSKIENYLTVLMRRKDVLKQQVDDEKLESGKQYIVGRISELDMIINELGTEFGFENPSKISERQPEKKGITIVRLEKNGLQEIADRVRDWRNSKGTHYGWDSWFVSEYGEDFARDYDINTILVSKK